MNMALKIELTNLDLDSVISSNQYFIMKLGIKWAHGDLNPGSSPCKGDVITDLDYEPRNLPC